MPHGAAPGGALTEVRAWSRAPRAHAAHSLPFVRVASSSPGGGYSARPGLRSRRQRYAAGCGPLSSGLSSSGPGPPGRCRRSGRASGLRLALARRRCLRAGRFALSGPPVGPSVGGSSGRSRPRVASGCGLRRLGSSGRGPCCVLPLWLPAASLRGWSAWAAVAVGLAPFRPGRVRRRSSPRRLAASPPLRPRGGLALPPPSPPRGRPFRPPGHALAAARFWGFLVPFSAFFGFFCGSFWGALSRPQTPKRPGDNGFSPAVQAGGPCPGRKLGLDSVRGGVLQYA